MLKAGQKLAQFQWNSPCSSRNGSKSSQFQLKQPDLKSEVPSEYSHTEQSLDQKDEALKQILNKTWRASNAKRVWGRIQEKDIPLNSRVVEKNSEWQWTGFVGSVPVCLSNQWNVDLKKIECQIFLHQRWVYSGSAENCNSGSAPVVSPCKTLHSRRRRMLLYREKEAGRAAVNKESMASYWLRPCQERRGVFLLPLGLCYLHRVWELLLLVSQLCITEVSVY